MQPLALFSALGIELEYMIVDKNTLSVNPIADQLIYFVCGHYANEVIRKQVLWSNELARHVIELKGNGPIHDLVPYVQNFSKEINFINQLLMQWNACLMPSAMHPWMIPDKETQLWTHGDRAIYDQFNAIFDCRGHGWSNLQSMHINLPFANDAEFVLLHSVIRLLMPIMPALSASSPVVESQLNGIMDNRLMMYASNCQRIPSITAQVIPEVVTSIADYHDKILKPIYQDIGPLDPNNILQKEWLNARGAIARFERATIEIRILDVQENPEIDLAIAALIEASLEYLAKKYAEDKEHLMRWPQAPLVDIYANTVRAAGRASIVDRDYLRLFDINEVGITALEIWHSLYATLKDQLQPWQIILEQLLQQGCLAERISQKLITNSFNFHAEYKKLCECLDKGKFYTLA